MSPTKKKFNKTSKETFVQPNTVLKPTPVMLPFDVWMANPGKDPFFKSIKEADYYVARHHPNVSINARIRMANLLYAESECIATLRKAASGYT